MFTYHCTVLHGLMGESWSLVGNTQAGSFTFLTLNFVWSPFSLAVQQQQQQKVNTGRQFLADRGEKKLGAPRLFFSLFSFLFRSQFLDRVFFFFFTGGSWTRSRRGWVFGTGLVSAFTFTVWLTDCRPCGSQRTAVRLNRSPTGRSIRRLF